MKTVKFLSALFVIALLTFNLAIGQPKNYTITEEPYYGWAYDGSEMVSGIQITETKWNKNKVQVKVTWHLVGETSGANYEAGFIENNIIHDLNNGVYNQTYTFHFFGKKDNVPMGYGQATGHVTINPDGITKVDFYDIRWINFY
ncbi:MAG: hypothetical protein ACQERS_02725 [Bacteroidota bacterium]|jgi:hypothetical protein